MKKNKQLKVKTKAKRKAPKVLTVKKILKKKEGVKLLPSKEEEFKIRKVKVKIVGLGGGGASVVSEISSLLHSQSFLACDTDIRTAKKIKKGVKFFQFGQNALQGMGTGINIEAAEKAAVKKKEKIGQILGGRDHTTVMYAYQKVSKEVENNESIQEEINLIKERLYNN